MFRLTVVIFRLSLEPLLLYRVVVLIWDPLWLTVFLLRFFIQNMAYIYFAIISRVRCVGCAKLLVSVVLLLL